MTHLVHLMFGRSGRVQQSDLTWVACGSREQGQESGAGVDRKIGILAGELSGRRAQGQR